MDMEAVWPHDRRQAAIHEAGHLTVACMRGVQFARACIYRRDDVTDPREQKTYGGQMSSGDMPPCVYVAGEVAEAVAADPDVEADELVEWIWMDLMGTSPTDAAGMPEDSAALYEAVVEAMDLLRSDVGRRFLDWAVAQLCEYELITDGMARDKLRDLWPVDDGQADLASRRPTAGCRSGGRGR